MPTTRYPFSSRNSARYEPSCPVMPVMSAVRMISFVWTTAKRGAPRSSPDAYWTGGAEPSRHLHAAGCAGHLAGVEAARADLHLGGLAANEGTHNLKVRLPGAARLVVRV